MHLRCFTIKIRMITMLTDHYRINIVKQGTQSLLAYTIIQHDHEYASQKKNHQNRNKTRTKEQAIMCVHLALALGKENKYLL